MDVFCCFKELFSVDTCQVLSIPQFHLLIRGTIVCKNTEVLSFFSTKQKIKRGERGVGRETLPPLHSIHSIFVFLPKSHMKSH